MRSKKIEEIFLNNLFECEGYACHIERDIENVAPGLPPKTTLKIYADKNRPLHYSYAPRSGLNLTGTVGSAIDKNILGKLLAIPDENIEAHIDFFETYGFLLPVSYDSYESIDAADAIELVNRIKATVFLMNSIAAQKNYKNILINIAYLLYNDPLTVSLLDGEYSSCLHEFTSLLHSYNDYPDINSDAVAYNTGKYNVFDSMLKNVNPIDIDFFNSVRSGNSNSLPGSQSTRFKHLFAMYTGMKDADPSLRLIIDFFYNFQMSRGIFNNVPFKHITYHSKLSETAFTNEMQEALINIAHSVIAAEINHNIQGIHPFYNPGGLAPTWKVNTLMQALYFSIFYMKPEVEIYKECENPNCKRDRFFLIEATRTNKKYCCQQCANAAAGQRYRSRKLDK